MCFQLPWHSGIVLNVYVLRGKCTGADFLINVQDCALSTRNHPVQEEHVSYL